jgi:hypothetical protein
MLIKLELWFKTQKSQDIVRKEIDKILSLSNYTMKYNLEFKEEQ